MKFMLERSSPPATARVLELGCGTGSLLGIIARLRPDLRLYGIDRSAPMLRRAQASATARASLMQADAMHLPWRPATADLVFFSLSLHLMDDLRLALREAIQSLRPGGRLAIWTLSREHISNFHLRRFFPSVVDIDMKRFPAPGELLWWLLEADLSQCNMVAYPEPRQVSLATLVDRVAHRYISTLWMLDEDEYRNGLRAMHRAWGEDPNATVSYSMGWVLLEATVGKP